LTTQRSESDELRPRDEAEDSGHGSDSASLDELRDVTMHRSLRHIARGSYDEPRADEFFHRLQRAALLGLRLSRSVLPVLRHVSPPSLVFKSKCNLSRDNEEERRENPVDDGGPVQGPDGVDVGKIDSHRERAGVTEH